MNAFVGDVQFPILLQDRDGWLREVRDERAMQTDVEYNDADAAEYRGWDSQGRSLRIVWKDDRVSVVDLSLESDVAGMEEALARYLLLAHLGKGLDVAVGGGSPRDRWARVLGMAKDRPFWKRLFWG